MKRDELFSDDPLRGAEYFGGIARIAVEFSAIPVLHEDGTIHPMYSAAEAGERAAIAAHYARIYLEACDV